jgi:hypothetical protein
MKIKNLFFLAAAMLIAGCGNEEIPLNTGETCIVKTCKDEGAMKNYDVKLAGIRSSYYGFGLKGGGYNNRKFPTPDEAATVMKNIAKKFDQAIPSAVWIVGGIHNKDCHLEFEQMQTSDPHIKFSNPQHSPHEEYLTKFDEIGAKVYLQVEAGRADMKELIRLVLDKYSHHPSVAGFGIDVEWYPSDGETNGSGEKVDVKLDTNYLKELEALVKCYEPCYKIFVKHYDAEYLGKEPVGDVVYINDSYGFKKGMNDFVKEFSDWANQFYPNEVGFQIGYEGLDNNIKEDYAWWSKLDDPILEMTQAVMNKMKYKNMQTVNVYWVDFTIRWEEFDDLWKE